MWVAHGALSPAATLLEGSIVSETELSVISDDQVEGVLRGTISSIDALKIEDPREVQMQIIARILDSDGLDEILGGTTSTQGKDILGRPFTLRGARWMRSSLADEQALPLFIIMDCSMLDTGEELAVTTGALNVLAQVFAMQKQDLLPADVKLVESEKPTAQGYRPQWLTPAVDKSAA